MTEKEPLQSNKRFFFQLGKIGKRYEQAFSEEEMKNVTKQIRSCFPQSARMTHFLPSVHLEAVLGIGEGDGPLSSGQESPQPFQKVGWKNVKIRATCAFDPGVLLWGFHFRKMEPPVHKSLLKAKPRNR